MVPSDDDDVRWGDRRGTARHAITLRVDYKRMNTFFADYARNISKGGTFIRTRKTLPIGTRFLFRLAVPGRPEPFELSGEVVHAGGSGDEPGMGIRFVWDDPTRREEFEGLVEGLMQESLGPLVAQHLLRKQ